MDVYLPRLSDEVAPGLFVDTSFDLSPEGETSRISSPQSAVGFSLRSMGLRLDIGWAVTGSGGDSRRCWPRLSLGMDAES